MTIRCIYEEEPEFPASDQHPDAVRYKVGSWWVDAIGSEPTADDIKAVLSPPAPLEVDPIEKFKIFLQANPDVKVLLEG